MDRRKPLSILRTQYYHSFALLLIALFLGGHGRSQYLVGGDAEAIGGDCFRLTVNEAFEGGYVYEQTSIDLTEPFDLQFYVQLGANDGGADGIVFVLRDQISTNLIGGSGGGLGFNGAGFTSGSIGIEVDTWQNTEVSDPAADHIAILADGINDHASANNLAGPIQASAQSNNVEDGAEHILGIRWDPDTETLEVFFDCEERLSYSGDIVADIFDGDPEVYWGFLGTTGGATNIQEFCGPFSMDGLTNELTAFLLCPGDSVQLNAGDTSLDYLWMPSTSLSDSLSHAPWASPSDSTTYVVRKTFECDTVFDTVDVNIFPFVLDVLSDTGVCDSLFEIEGPVGAEDYLWNSGETTANITVDSSGLYTVIVSSWVCVDTDSIYVQISHPEFSFTDTVLCGGVLELSVDNSSGQTLWSTGDTIDSISVTQSGIYWVELENDYCDRRDSVDVRFRPVSVELWNDSTFCEPTMIIPDVTGQDVSLLWSTGDTSMSILHSSDQEVWLTVSNEWCADSDTSFYSVEYFGINDSFFLYCEPVQHKIDAGGGWSTYLWNTGSVDSSITVNESGTYSVVVSSANCSFSDSVAFVFSAYPEFELGDDKLICTGQEIQIVPSAFWPGLRWNTGSTDSILSVSDTGLFIAEASLLGCFFSDSIRVDRRSLAPDSFYVSNNVFTPNGDGMNDLFRISFEDPSLVSTEAFHVYNRWGSLVYDAQVDGDGWDGSLPSGEPAPSGTYFYLIRATSQCTDMPTIEVRENVTLIR